MFECGQAEADRSVNESDAAAVTETESLSEEVVSDVVRTSNCIFMEEITQRHCLSDVMRVKLSLSQSVSHRSSEAPKKLPQEENSS